LFVALRTALPPAPLPRFWYVGGSLGGMPVWRNGDSGSWRSSVRHGNWQTRQRDVAPSVQQQQRQHERCVALTLATLDSSLGARLLTTLLANAQLA